MDGYTAVCEHYPPVILLILILPLDIRHSKLYLLNIFLTREKREPVYTFHITCPFDHQSPDNECNVHRVKYQRPRKNKP